MATVKKTTEVKADVPVTTDKPGYLKQFEGKGPIKDSSNFDQTDVTIPRVKLIQAMSKEPETFNSAKAGIFWHTGADLALGTQFDFVPISRRKRYLLVAPINDGRGILARSEDCVTWQPPKGEFKVNIKGKKTPQIWKLAPTVAESGLDKWGTYNDDDENSPPAACLFYEYLSFLPRHLDLGPVVISLTRSQIKKAKKGLNDKVQLHASAGRPMQSLVFHAEVVKEAGQMGEYYNWQFHANGFASEPLFKQAWDLKDVLQNYKIKDEEEAAREEEPKSEAKEY